MSKRIGVLGGGSWGTALGILLANKGYDVHMWLRDENQIMDMNETRINNKYLPDITLPSNLKLTNDLEKVNFNKDAIVLSVGTHGIREVLNNCKSYIKKDQIIVNVSKGIENQSLLRISEIVEEIVPNSRYTVLSGPSHAEEVAKNMPTTVVSASKSKEVAQYVQDLFITPSFRVYTNPDVIGVELGGALKNIIALGAGISDGSGWGDNTKAALMTRGIYEMARLGEKMGAQASTFLGLAGIGDLIVTCTSMLSRNRRAGILIGKGIKVEDAIKEIGMVVEGIKTTKSTFDLSKKYNIDMPIAEELYGVLYEGKDVKNSVSSLMVRDKKHEMENIVLENNNLW
ncbi:NAD(P)H-dependent glycerol-3-phosphate dehydrogenase [Tissierella pigra]|uniref:Glycerol-3-phosphate dehydrogenase [NAD(P)+] n=1 Tax=Tissierella pigra TaxID=2607614 RepID=A0A6N7Y0A6_9FIRM|nr:NAD(P)H-dependent glycerol-3-phosphate dehydrogenase [Tissierella pigra]MBU5426444.1 NAD(P)H-dependent glycerol-3-phosphate dehydrogenase [Tissierella pigra]MSU02294.1 NAD(P)H-dependent glycerol-3-phosphate dehydrogenase [Tissierella pigra]